MTFERISRVNESKKPVEINYLEIKREKFDKSKAEENVVYFYENSFEVINKIGNYTFNTGVEFLTSEKGKYSFGLSYYTLEFGYGVIGLTKEEKDVLGQNFINLFYTIKKYMKDLPIIISCSAIGNTETEADKDDIISKILNSPENYQPKESLIKDRFVVLKDIYYGLFHKRYKTKFADKANLVLRLRSKIQEEIFRKNFPEAIITRENIRNFTVEI